MKIIRPAPKAANERKEKKKYFKDLHKKKVSIAIVRIDL